MPIPTYDALMLPVLRHSAEKMWSMRDLISTIADEIGLTEAERQQQIPSGGTTVFGSRVNWAKTYLKQAGLVEQPKRSMVQITPRGSGVLKSNPAKINVAFLQQFEEFRAFQRKTKPSAGAVVASTVVGAAAEEPSSTPDEQIDAAARALDESLRDALMARVLEGSPTFFEKMIVDLLLAMGYGGSKTDAGQQLGGTGDGGVDGVIREDQLGLDRIYLQAKRYKLGNTVGSEAVQAFVGALVGQGAQKGVFITTSTFSKAALQVAKQSGSLRLVLIDGDELSKLMVRFNVGVRVAQTVEIKKVDFDYFEGDDAE